MKDHSGFVLKTYSRGTDKIKREGLLLLLLLLSRLGTEKED